MYQGGFIWDYMDQALWQKNALGSESLGYGGDFEERQSDYGFSGNGIVTADGREIGIQTPPALFALIGRVQEEVHRFAIAYHHQKHTKSAYRSQLDGIPGVGEARKKLLLQRFGTVKAVRAADLPQLEEVLPKPAAHAVYDHFHKETTP